MLVISNFLPKKVGLENSLGAFISPSKNYHFYDIFFLTTEDTEKGELFDEECKGGQNDLII